MDAVEWNATTYLWVGLSAAYTLLALFVLFIFLQKLTTKGVMVSMRRRNFTLAFYFLILVLSSVRATAFALQVWNPSLFWTSAGVQDLITSGPSFLFVSVELLMLTYWYECFQLSFRRETHAQRALHWALTGLRPVLEVFAINVVGWTWLIFLHIVTAPDSLAHDVFDKGLFGICIGLYSLLCIGFFVMGQTLAETLANSPQYFHIARKARFVLQVTTFGLFCRVAGDVIQILPELRRSWAVQTVYYGCFELLLTCIVLATLWMIKADLRAQLSTHFLTPYPETEPLN
eukprot:TRINITY_DN8290_c0_g1_i1.p1 TRINITY_DN8290_c0_g1~~TRINITY_DN8290_c0_g1_i1.p1  ORF type:complete len:288 (-),score=46.09 TRINITY_DN8290_c0_g1_i1:114-977(-)